MRALPGRGAVRGRERREPRSRSAPSGRCRVAGSWSCVPPPEAPGLGLRQAPGTGPASPTDPSAGPWACPEDETARHSPGSSPWAPAWRRGWNVLASVEGVARPMPREPPARGFLGSKVCRAGHHSPTSLKPNPTCLTLGRTLVRTGRKRKAPLFGLCPSPTSSPRGLKAGGARGHLATRRSPERQVVDRQRARGHVPCPWAWSDQHDHPVAAACDLEASPASSSWERQWPLSARTRSGPGRAPHSRGPQHLSREASLTLFLGSCPSKALHPGRGSGVGFRDRQGGGRAGCEPRPV